MTKKNFWKTYLFKIISLFYTVFKWKDKPIQINLLGLKKKQILVTRFAKLLHPTLFSMMNTALEILTFRYFFK